MFLKYLLGNVSFVFVLKKKKKPAAVLVVHH